MANWLPSSVIYGLNDAVDGVRHLSDANAPRHERHQSDASYHNAEDIEATSSAERPSPSQSENEISGRTADVDGRGSGESESEEDRPQLSTSAVSSNISCRKEVFLNFEVLRAGQHKMAQAMWFLHLCGAAASYGVFMYLFGFERAITRAIVRQNIEQLQSALNGGVLSLLQQQVFLKVYLAVAVYCFILTLSMVAWSIVRLAKTRNFQWTRRQRYLVTLSFLKLFVQMVNLFFWLVPNIYALASPCRYFSKLADGCAFIRYTCFNTIFTLTMIHCRNCGPALAKRGKDKDKIPRVGDDRYKYDGNDPMILDRSALTTHWFPISIWIIVESGIIYFAASGFYSFGRRGVIARQPAPTFCGPDSALPRSTSLKVFVFFLILPTLYTFQVSCSSVFARYSSIKLRGQPYTIYQFANLLIMWQRKQSIWMDILAMADVSLLYGSGSMLSYFQRWYGSAGLQLMLTTTSILDAFYLLPMEPSNEEHVYNAWLQQCIWVDKEVTPRMRAILKQSPTLARAVGSQAIFCMETAFKLLVWSTVVYEDAAADERMPPLKGHSILKPNRLRNQRMQVQENGDAEVHVPPVGEAFNSKREDENSLPRSGMERQDSKDDLEHESILASAQDTGQFQQPKSDEPISEETREISNERRNSEQYASDRDKAKEKAASALKSELTTQQYLCMAMDMYKLTDMKIIVGPLTDTKAIIAWNHTSMVLTFRGTSSLANVRSDLKILRDYHEPRRGSYWLGKSPLVHRGFQIAWKEIKDRVMAQMATIVETVHCPSSLLRVYITGHSLGGALGVLAAYDIQSKYHFPRLLCYTFGAPRPGNKALADELSRLVPNMYHVINDRDAVPAHGKFGVFYKRPGLRVLINARGDIRVRPTIFEINLHSGGFSVKMHLLKAYLDSLSAICVSQLFKTKAMPGGLKGVKRLARSDEICILLKSAGIDMRDLLQNPDMDYTKLLKDKSAKSLMKQAKRFQSNLTVLIKEELLMLPFW